jgi:hypothetical protein
MIFGVDPYTGYEPQLAGRGKRAAVIYTSAVWGPQLGPEFGTDFQSTYFGDWLRTRLRTRVPIDRSLGARRVARRWSSLQGAQSSARCRSRALD